MTTPVAPTSAKLMARRGMRPQNRVLQDRDAEIPDDGQIQLRNLGDRGWKFKGNFAHVSAARRLNSQQTS